MFVDDSTNTGAMLGTVNNTNFVLCRYNSDRNQSYHSIQTQVQYKDNSKDCVQTDPLLVSKVNSAMGLTLVEYVNCTSLHYPLGNEFQTVIPDSQFHSIFKFVVGYLIVFS